MKDYSKTKKTFRTLGFIILPIGLVLSIIGFIDFFMSFNSMTQPKLFFCLFIGLPLTSIGIIFLILGFMKELNSFAASQSAPVHKDVINYMLDGTREEVNKTINASKKIICPECKAENDKDALFCSTCGHKLKNTCPKCNAENDADAKFCKNCGEELNK
ncbi:MAG: zinc ribbon domain-containing protein [Bacilli bacterium]